MIINNAVFLFLQLLPDPTICFVCLILITQFVFLAAAVCSCLCLSVSVCVCLLLSAPVCPATGRGSVLSVSVCSCLSATGRGSVLSAPGCGGRHLVGLLRAEAAALQEVGLLRNNLVDAHARVSLEDRGTT